MILAHIGDFIVAGAENIVQNILVGVSNQITVSKVEREKLHFTEQIQIPMYVVEVPLKQYIKIDLKHFDLDIVY